MNHNHRPALCRPELQSSRITWGSTLEPTSCSEPPLEATPEATLWTLQRRTDCVGRGSRTHALPLPTPAANQPFILLAGQGGWRQGGGISETCSIRFLTAMPGNLWIACRSKRAAQRSGAVAARVVPRHRGTLVCPVATNSDGANARDHCTSEEHGWLRTGAKNSSTYVAACMVGSPPLFTAELNPGRFIHEHLL